MKILPHPPFFPSFPPSPKVMKELVDASSLKPEIVEGVDIMVVRELTGDVYFGTPKASKGNKRIAECLPSYRSYPCALPSLFFKENLV